MNKEKNRSHFAPLKLIALKEKIETFMADRTLNQWPQRGAVRLPASLALTTSKTKCG